MSGRMYIVAAAFFWSFGGLLIKIVTGHFGVDPGGMTCIRSVIAGLALAWAIPGVRGAQPGRVGLAGLAYSAAVLTFVLSTSITSAANAIFLEYLFPLLVAVGAVWLFREKLQRRTVAALALGMAGVAVIVLGSWAPGQKLGLVLGLANALAVTVFVFAQRTIRKGNPIGLVSIYNFIAAGLMLPLVFRSIDLQMSLPALAVIAVMAVFQLSLPYAMFSKGLRTVPAAEASLIALLEPVLNPVWVWLFIGETPNLWTLIGGGTILAALLVYLACSLRDSQETIPVIEPTVKRIPNSKFRIPN